MDFLAHLLCQLFLKILSIEPPGRSYPQSWFVVRYGPFRRLSESSSNSGLSSLVARVTTLFHAHASLSGERAAAETVFPPQPVHRGYAQPLPLPER
jgi:hypothetical protein